MDAENKEKIAIVTDNNIFYYTWMPFGLKNTGAELWSTNSLVP